MHSALVFVVGKGLDFVNHFPLNTWQGGLDVSHVNVSSILSPLTLNLHLAPPVSSPSSFFCGSMSLQTYNL